MQEKQLQDLELAPNTRGKKSKQIFHDYIDSILYPTYVFSLDSVINLKHP